MEQYDIFISYKRKSLPTANNLYYRLKTRGYSVFFDLEELGRDNFNNQLLYYIECAKDVFVIVEEGSLDACQEEGWENDWFCKEISYALEKEKNIIPILLGDYKMPDEDFFPEKLKAFHFKQSPEFNFAFFEAYLDKLEEKKFLLSEPTQQDKSTSIFKFYSNEDCQIYKDGKLVCSLDGMSDVPFYLPVPRKGDYRFKIINDVTKETRIVNEVIDAVEERNVEIIWKKSRKKKNDTKKNINTKNFRLVQFDSNIRKKLFIFDLFVCFVGIFCMFGGRYYLCSPIGQLPPVLVIVPVIFFRLITSFSVYYSEKRSWIPLALLSPWLVFFGGHDGYRSSIGRAISIVLNIENDTWAIYVLRGFLFFLLFVAPYINYVVLLITRQLSQTELTWKDFFGGIFLHGRMEKAIGAVFTIMFVSIITGLSMNASTCIIICLVAVPITYWILCSYHRIKPAYIWILMINMALFYGAQFFSGMWRISLLIISSGMTIYVMTCFYKKTKKVLLTIACVLYLGIILPTISIGYNQFACIKYPRYNAGTLYPYKGILLITDSTRELYGIRDRYGLLVEPAYEHIGEVEERIKSSIVSLQKDGFTQYYDIENDCFVEKSSILPNLQHLVRTIIESYFTETGHAYDDMGHVVITNIFNGDTIADVRIKMNGNPYLIYSRERFIPDDSITIAPNQFFRNDCIEVHGESKVSMCCALNSIFNQYRIYIMIVKDRILSEKELFALAYRVASLQELNELP